MNDIHDIFNIEVIKGIFISLLASGILYLINRWLGLFKKIQHFVKNENAYNKYKQDLIDKCNTLIVVGRREGFSLNKVYIKLDLVQSELIREENSYNSTSQSFVLLGGPGAGKSTTAKKRVIKHLKNYNTCLPFFVRLRDYYGNTSIESFLVEKLDFFGFSNTNIVVRNELSTNPLCVLDGLDEIRPNLRDTIINEINIFYKKYFLNSGTLIVTCRKEAYRDLPLDIKTVLEVSPLSDMQIELFSNKWPLKWPENKNPSDFLRDLSASPRIMELTRSPLLLVGGLMHYTEANLGLPEERFDYLKTISAWLIQDWAKAQDHNFDKYRKCYEKILMNLAFYMHSNFCSEVSIDIACNYIEKILPDYGFDKSEAKSLINSIIVKTGVLIQEGNQLFFTQFVLQEYYASLDISNHFTIREISLLTPLHWWREVDLLYVAQLNNPTELLSCFFINDPILAVAAVAECPTPSIEMQNRAVDTCLYYIDNELDVIKLSLIAFLRKVRGRIEIVFYEELEKRLIVNEKVSTIVVLSLATVGTPAATCLLGKYPELWSICLNEVGYLSNSFENLLINWISEVDDSRSFKAIDLIVNRLNTDKLNMLIRNIPKLNIEWKEYLSIQLLRKMANIEGDLSYDEFSIICQLSENIRNFDFVGNILKGEESYITRRDLTSSVFFLVRIRDSNLEMTTAELMTLVLDSIFWVKNNVAFLFWICSLLLLSGLFGNIFLFSDRVYFSIILICYIVYICAFYYNNFVIGTNFQIFLSRLKTRRELGLKLFLRSFIYILFFILGLVSMVFYFNSKTLFEFDISPEFISRICIISSSIILSLIGFIFYENDRLNSKDKKFSIAKRVLLINTSILLLSISYIVVSFFYRIPESVYNVLASFSILGFSALLLYGYSVYKSWIIVYSSFK